MEGIKQKLDKENVSYKVGEDGVVVFRLPYSPGYEFHVVDEKVEGGTVRVLTSYSHNYEKQFLQVILLISGNYADPIRQVTLVSSNIEETSSKSFTKLLHRFFNHESKILCDLLRRSQNRRFSCFVSFCPLHLLLSLIFIHLYRVLAEVSSDDHR